MDWWTIGMIICFGLAFMLWVVGWFIGLIWKNPIKIAGFLTMIIGVVYILKKKKQTKIFNAPILKKLKKLK